MANVSERVQPMKKSFMDLHKAGYSIPEMAEIIKCSNGERAQMPDKKQVRVNFNELNNGFDVAKNAIAGLIEEIDKTLEAEQQW